MSGIAQNFKGDAVELQMRASAEPAFELTLAALDDMYEQVYNSDAFLLAMYDAGRMPYSDRIDRDSFVPFIRKALENFPFMGNYESYIFILTEIFGESTEIFFDNDDPGILTIDVSAAADIDFEFIGREYVDGVYEYFNISDFEDNDLLFRGVAGIDSEYKLNLLFAEMMPAGIVPDISLAFYAYSVFIGDESGVTFTMTDRDGNFLIFFEEG